MPAHVEEDAYEADFEQVDDGDGKEEEEEELYEDDFEAVGATAAAAPAVTAAPAPEPRKDVPAGWWRPGPLGTPAAALTSGRRPVATCSPGAAVDDATTPEVCIAYGRSSDKAEALRRPGGLLLVWRPMVAASSNDGGSCSTATNSRSIQTCVPSPAAVLACEGNPVACCYGAGACARVVVAATSDGALCAWDLREAAAAAAAGEGQVPCGLAATHAAFTTAAGAASRCIGNSSSEGSPELPVAIAAVAPPAPAGGAPPCSSSSSGGGGGGGACSIVMLGTSGRINVWSLRLLPGGIKREAPLPPPRTASPTAAAAALGAAPGSRVAIVYCHSSVDLSPAVWAVVRQRRLLVLPVAVRTSQSVGEVDVCATCLATVTDEDGSDSGSSRGSCGARGNGEEGLVELLVGTASGAVLRCAPLCEPPPPRAYFPREGARGGTCLGDIEDGSNGGINSSSSSNSSPATAGLGVWGSAVAAVAASPHVRGAFLAAHADGRLALHAGTRSSAAKVWHCGCAPLLSVRWSPLRACVAFTLDAEGTVCAYDLLRDAHAPVVAFAAAAAAGTRAPPCALELAAAGRAVAVALADGSALWRAIPSHLCDPQAGELDALRALLA